MTTNETFFVRATIFIALTCGISRAMICNNVVFFSLDKMQLGLKLTPFPLS